MNQQDEKKLNRVGEPASKESSSKELIDRYDKLIETLREHRNSERFIFVFIIIMLIDIRVFPLFENGLSSLTLGILQVVFLIFLGYTLRVKIVAILFNKVLRVFSKSEKSESRPEK